MLDTSQWPRIELDVLNEIQLDSKNVRLELSDAKIDADIMQDLFANENALDLVDGICKIGYLTHETPIVLPNHGKYVVVEGNRRLAALKAIQNPMLVPDFEARLKKATESLTEETRESLSKVEVLVAPSENEAEQLIAAIHTSNLRKPWSPGRQAAFFQAQIDAGRTFAELTDRYPTINVRKFVFRARILNLFKSLNYENPELQDYVNSKKWMTSSSTLARIYTSKDFLQLTGLSMDSQGQIVKTISDSMLLRIATIIVDGIRSGRLNTRTINSTKSSNFKELMAELREAANDKESEQPSSDLLTDPISATSDNSTSDGSDNTDDDNLDNPSHKNDSIGKHNRQVNRSTKWEKEHYLDFNQIKIPDEYPEGTKRQLIEISQLDVQKFPTLTYLAIRSTLEKSIKAFSEIQTKDPDCIKKSGKNTNGYVHLKDTLNWLHDYAKEIGAKQLIQPIRHVNSSGLFDYSSRQDALNAVNHNQLFVVNAKDSFNAWSSINPIMRFVTNL